MLKLIKKVGVKKVVVAGIKEIHRKVWREIVKGSYAQDYEDLIIGKMLKNHGFFLEIGAYHPTRLSNTFRFYKNNWRGVVVEPNPEVRKLFESKRPEDKFLNVGVGERSGEMTYYRYLIPALNTFSKTQVEENRMNGYIPEKTEKVKITGIKELLDKEVHQKIDFLSLDVEGWDLKILKKWDWRKKPGVICIETSGDSQTKNYLENKGYKYMERTKYNSIFVSV